MRSLDTSRIAQLCRFSLALTIVLHACACSPGRSCGAPTCSWLQLLSSQAASL